MKKKKLNLLKLIFVNLSLFSIFCFIGLLIPNNFRIVLVWCFSYFSIAVLFNLFITEKGEK